MDPVCAAYRPECQTYSVSSCPGFEYDNASVIVKCTGLESVSYKLATYFPQNIMSKYNGPDNLSSTPRCVCNKPACLVIVLDVFVMSR